MKKTLLTFGLIVSMVLVPQGAFADLSSTTASSTDSTDVATDTPATTTSSTTAEVVGYLTDIVAELVSILKEMIENLNSDSNSSSNGSSGNSGSSGSSNSLGNRLADILRRMGSGGLSGLNTGRLGNLGNTGSSALSPGSSPAGATTPGLGGTDPASQNIAATEGIIPVLGPIEKVLKCQGQSKRYYLKIKDQYKTQTISAAGNTIGALTTATGNPILGSLITAGTSLATSGEIIELVYDHAEMSKIRFPSSGSSSQSSGSGTLDSIINSATNVVTALAKATEVERSYDDFKKAEGKTDVASRFSGKYFKDKKFKCKPEGQNQEKEYPLVHSVISPAASTEQNTLPSSTSSQTGTGQTIGDQANSGLGSTNPVANNLTDIQQISDPLRRSYNAFNSLCPSCNTTNWVKDAGYYQDGDVYIRVDTPTEEIFNRSVFQNLVEGTDGAYYTKPGIASGGQWKFRLNKGNSWVGTYIP